MATHDKWEGRDFRPVLAPDETYGFFRRPGFFPCGAWGMSANTAGLIKVFFTCARCGHSKRNHQHDESMCKASMCKAMRNVLIYGQGFFCQCPGFVAPSHASILTSDERTVSGRCRSFFVDVIFDEDGNFIGLQVQEHGELKDAKDERELAQAIRNYFEGKRTAEQRDAH